MAEQTGHDVVNQTRSGGDVSPSDGPASKPDDYTSKGDGEGLQSKNDEQSQLPQDTSSAQEAKSNGSGVTTSKETTTSTDNTMANGLGVKLTDRSVSPKVGDGSDADISRPESRTTGDGNQHSRASSVKRTKPVTFAKVNFSKSPGPAAAPKPVAEPAPFSSTPSTTPVQHSSRLRLVSKSTSGLSSTPRSLGGSRAGSTAPDPSQVWNKNRPAQPQPTPSKNITDKELRETFGIHMASRLEADSDGKEAKWADIEDDEDDWAPDTIEWTDGTKITLGQADTVLQNQQLERDAKEKELSISKFGDKAIGRVSSKMPAPKPPSNLRPNTTILRVGGHADKQQAKAGDISKAPSEKPTLVVKGSSAPKSPWAPLPPVDKVSPVPINPSQGPHGSRIFPHERAPSDTAAVAPQPTKEIAADDFNRSWRDIPSSAPRELFNSQSGRYEPVMEGRRSHPRNDRNEQFRPLLQRPIYHEQAGPAEPSAAFQTHRTSTADSPAWGRRRGSSNVSGGSGAVFGRRMSINKPEVPRHVELQPDQFPDRSVSPARAAPGGPQGPPPSNAPYRVNMSSHYAPPGPPQVAPPAGAEQVPAVPEEDPVAMQQRIMREKRELARQRRMEEEQKEEAAKQERIRLKLEALGPPPAKQQPKEAASPEPPKQATPHTHIQSPPKPPVPEPTGEPKQYGMMKVHHPETVKKMVGSGDRVPEKPFGPGHQGRRLSSPRQPKAEVQQPERTINGIQATSEPGEEQKPQLVEPSLEPRVEERQSQWKAPVPAPGPFTSWGGSRFNSQAAGPAGSLWGLPSADRALGNGTFDRNLTSFPLQDIPSSGSLTLSEQLSVEPSSAPGDGTGPTERLQPTIHTGPVTIAENSEVLSPLDSPEKRPATLYGNEHPKPIARPGPIAPPTTAYSQRRQAEQPHHPTQTAAWNNFHAVASRKEAEDTERFRREIAARREEAARTGITPALQVSFNETWRKVDTGDEAGQRTVVNVTRTASTAPENEPLGSLQNLDNAVTGLPFPHSYSKPAVSLPPRGSRFFPAAPEPPKPIMTHDSLSVRSFSPPPPEEISSHPVYATDSHRPLVHLPSPKPRVRLPPRSTRPSPPPTFSAVAAASPPALRSQARPIASTSVWQERFNGLLGKRPAQPAQRVQSAQAKTNSLAVTSATKEPLDVLSLAPTASVSLPRDDLRDAGKVTSKEVEDEEAIFEDREPGSLPVVNVPNMAPPLAWDAAAAATARQPHSRYRPKYQKPVQSLSVEPYSPSDLTKDNTGTIVVVIRIPGKVVKTLPWAAHKKSNTSSRPRSNNHRHKKGPRSKDGSGSHQSQQAVKKAVTPNAASTTPRPSPATGNWASRVANTRP